MTGLNKEREGMVCVSRDALERLAEKPWEYDDDGYHAFRCRQCGYRWYRGHPTERSIEEHSETCAYMIAQSVLATDKPERESCVGDTEFMIDRLNTALAHIRSGNPHMASACLLADISRLNADLQASPVPPPKEQI